MTTAEKPMTYEAMIRRFIKRLEEEEAASCLDVGLYEILLDLTKRGYPTDSSCAGHRRGKGAGRGLISFVSSELTPGEKDNLLWLLPRYGLKDVKVALTGNATFAPMGSQYNRLFDTRPQDFDICFDVPLKRPAECPTCGGSDFWLHGEFYDDEETLNWLCKTCQPLPFNQPTDCQTPAIMKRLKELPALKVWDISEFIPNNNGKKGKGEWKVTKRVEAKTRQAVFGKLGKSREDDIIIQRVE